MANTTLELPPTGTKAQPFGEACISTGRFIEWAPAIEKLYLKASELRSLAVALYSDEMFKQAEMTSGIPKQRPNDPKSPLYPLTPEKLAHQLLQRAVFESSWRDLRGLNALLGTENTYDSDRPHGVSYDYSAGSLNNFSNDLLSGARYKFPTIPDIFNSFNNFHKRWDNAHNASTIVAQFVVACELLVRTTGERECLGTVRQQVEALKPKESGLRELLLYAVDTIAKLNGTPQAELALRG